MARVGAWRVPVSRRFSAWYSLESDIEYERSNAVLEAKSLSDFETYCIDLWLLRLLDTFRKAQPVSKGAGCGGRLPVRRLPGAPGPSGRGDRRQGTRCHVGCHAVLERNLHFRCKRLKRLVGAAGFEPATPAV